MTLSGVGLGLRWDFLDELVQRAGAGEAMPFDFLEVSPENYIHRGGRHPAALAWLAERYPIVTHGLTLSVGGSDPLDGGYLHDLGVVVRSLRSPWHSDHLCFGSAGGRALHDLLPIAFKRSSVQRIADRIRRARDAVGVPFAIENISYYWHPGRADVGEAEFLSSLCEAAECGLLLDLNNAYVNAANFGFDLGAWLRAAPLERVVQLHVAGHEWFAAGADGLGGPTAPRAAGALIVDTHGAPVCRDVLDRLQEVLRRTGPVPIVLERDQNVPSLDDLFAELDHIRAARAAPAPAPAA